MDYTPPTKKELAEWAAMVILIGGIVVLPIRMFT
jgi:hypothetical protein